jgi:hypothetical protein
MKTINRTPSLKHEPYQTPPEPPTTAYAESRARLERHKAYTQAVRHFKKKPTFEYWCQWMDGEGDRISSNQRMQIDMDDDAGDNDDRDITPSE